MTIATRLAALFAAAVVCTNAAAADNVTKRVDEVFKDWTRIDGPGCALAVTQDGNIVLERAHGMADLEQGVAIRPDTVFLMAVIVERVSGQSLGHCRPRSVTNRPCRCTPQTAVGFITASMTSPSTSPATASSCAPARSKD